MAAKAAFLCQQSDEEKRIDQTWPIRENLEYD